MDQQTIFDDLAPYADLIATSCPGTVPGQLQFVSAEDLWSTAFYSQATGVVAAQEQQIFNAKIGDAGGQGFTGTLGTGITNNKNGNQLPIAQCYVAMKTGFQVGVVSAAGMSSAQIWGNFTRSSDLMAVLTNFSWTLNVNNDVERRIGALIDYPLGAGVFAGDALGTLGGPTGAPMTGTGFNIPAVAIEYNTQNGGPLSQMRRLPTPIVFPPQTPVDIKIGCTPGFTLSDTATAVAGTATANAVAAGQWCAANSAFGIYVRQVFRGYRLGVVTGPRGATQEQLQELAAQKGRNLQFGK